MVTAAALKTNARETPSAFVGRVAERARIESYFLEGARLVSIVAAGGMGKTRVATRFASEHAAAYSVHGGSGAWVCDLTLAKSATAIGAVVASTLSIALGTTASEGDVMRELGLAIARHRRVLLVLDNFEHLVADAAATVGEWMRAAPLAHFLVTTRVPLNLPGEQLLPLDELPRAEAVELFTKRVREVRPEIKLEDEELLRVADIVRRLDGIPLAIELAAARAFTLSLTQIQDRLGDPLDLLVRRGDAGRHASMRRAITDSHKLLTDEERACFAGCAVFKGGFTLDAAEAILPAPVLSSIEALSLHSLLRIEAAPASRFSMYETIREFSATCLKERADADDIARRHSVYYTHLGNLLAREVTLKGGGPKLHDLGMELENIVAAHEQAVNEAAAQHSKDAATRALSLSLALEPLCSARGLFRLRLRVLDKSISTAENAAIDAPHDLARALIARGQAHGELSDFATAERDLNRGLQIADASNFALLSAMAMARLGEIIELAGNTVDARALYARALPRAEASTEAVARVQEAELHERLGHVQRREGDLDGARIEIDRAAQLFRAVGHDTGLARTCYEGAVVAFFRGRNTDARTRFAEGLALAKRIGARDVEGAIETAVGSMLQELGEIDLALERHASAVVTFREIGKRTREGNTLYYLAGAHLERGDRAEALKLLAHAEERVKGERRYEALIRACRAAILADLRDHENASRELTAAEIAAAACAREPTLLATIAIHRLHVDAAKDPTARAKLLAEARAITEAHACDDPRFALRIFEAESTAIAPVALVISEDGFRMPSRAFVSLERRAPLRSMLMTLARKRIDAPGEALALEDLLAAGWPNERVGRDAAINRVRVAIATLRKLGLRDALMSAERGYLLSPATAVTISSPKNAS